MDVRNLTRPLASAAVDQHNIGRLDALKLRQGVIFHADATAPITEANATDATTTSALVLVLRSRYVSHIASACNATTGVGSHISADATNVVTVPVPADEAGEILTVNELKALFNLHRASAVFHPVADSTNVISAADATNTASLRTLANALKTGFNAHFAASLAGSALVVVKP
jgi:hypothetical protein